MGAGWNQPYDYSVKTFSPITWPLGRGEWLEIDLITNGQW